MRDISVGMDYSLTPADREEIDRILHATSSADGYDPVADLKQTLGSAPPARRKRYKSLGWVLSIGFMPWGFPCFAHHCRVGPHYATCVLGYAASLHGAGFVPLG